jgi:uncharacterized protein YraI
MAWRHAVAFTGSALGLWLYSTASNAAVTHTTANLNLRSGPSTSHKVRAVIPAGAAIDIHSCGHTWCYMGWAGHEGYVHSDYLVDHVTVVVEPLVHVHVHEHLHVHEHHVPQPTKMGVGT